jgi:hypothetical protein
MYPPFLRILKTMKSLEDVWKRAVRHMPNRRCPNLVQVRLQLLRHFLPQTTIALKLLFLSQNGQEWKARNRLMGLLLCRHQLCM